MIEINLLKKSFKNKDLLDQALTHRSWVNEHKGERRSNERMEFLGDAILEFVVSNEIYSRFPDKEEGYLTALRSNLVNTVALAEIAKKMNLGSELFLSKGEEDGGGRTNTSLLADTVEAIIGAIYMDQGLASATEFIKETLLAEVEKKSAQSLKDAKSSLQEFVQAKNLPTPKYQVMEETGPDHDKKFVIEVIVDGKSWGKGIGKSKNSAEQEAAGQALVNRLK